MNEGRQDDAMEMDPQGGEVSYGNMLDINLIEKAKTNETQPKHHSKVTFDEAIIKEHDKLRGTRQKIDEPKTPYQRNSFDEGDTSKNENIGSSNKDNSGGLRWGDFQTKLLNASENAEEPKAILAVKKKDFGTKRKAHYNEMEMVRKWRANKALGEENDDEDDNDDDNDDMNTN